MSNCPHCGHTNIEGVDVCEECLQPLTSLPKHRASTSVERSILKAPIRALDPHTPVCVSPDTTVGEALRQLVDQSYVGAILVVGGGELVGIFTERDALLRLNAMVSQYRDRPVSEFMTREPATLELDDKIAFAIQRMDLGGFRHLPILDNRRIVGIITVRDILRFLAQDRIRLQ